MAGEINFGIIDPKLGASFATGYNEAEDRRNELAARVQQRALGEQQLQHAMSQNELSKYTLSTAKRSDAQQEALNARVSSPDFNPNNPAHLQDLMRFGPPGQAMLKSIMDRATSEATLAKTRGEVNAQGLKAAKDKHDALAAALGPLAAMVQAGKPVTHNDVFGAAQQLLGSNVISQNDLASIPMRSEDLPKYVMGLVASNENSRNALKMYMPEAMISGGTLINKNPMAPGGIGSRIADVAPVASTAAALETAAAATSRARTDEARLRQSEEHFTRKLAEETAAGVLTPDTLEFAGQLVAQGGAMPTFGSGKTAAKMKQQVLDRAAQISTADGSSGAEAAAKMLTARAGQAGATTAERVLGSQGANVLLASSEAKKMIRVASDYSSLVDRSQYPTLNSIQNAVDKGTGGENIVALNTALNALVNSYARAINPKGVSTVSDKNHAREIVNSSYSNGQLNTVFKVMDKEMTAALESTGAARAVLRGKPEPAAGATPAAKPSLGEIFR